MQFMDKFATFCISFLSFISHAFTSDILNGNELSLQLNFNTNSSPEKIDTIGYTVAANNILNSMNTTTNPCDNFFQYACGRWIHEHPIPDDKSGYGTFVITTNIVRNQMKALLESNETVTPECIDVARILYKACMNVDKIKVVKTEQLIDAFRKIGKWPFIEENWDNYTFDITDMLASVTETFGDPILFKIFIDAESKNTTVHGLYIDQADLGLGSGTQDYYLNPTKFPTHLNAYKEYQLDTLKLVLSGANISYDISQLITDVNDVTAFEIEIAKFIEPEANRHDSSRLYNKRMIADLYKLFPQIDWIKFLIHLTPTSMHDIIDNNTNIIVQEMGFIKNLSNLLSITSNRIIANYISWRIIDVWSDILGKVFDDIRLKLLRVMSGQQKMMPRWQRCVQRSENLLAQATGALFVRKHFSSSIRKEVMDILENVQKAFRDTVKEIDWMDNSTKNAALQKAAAIINKIGYHDMSMNDTALTEYYKKLNITRDDTYFEALRKIVAWDAERYFSRLKKPFDKYEFVQSASTVNAFFTFRMNSLTLPAGFLTPPFFNRYYPKAANYGAIGTVMGHELTHGFDDDGSLYDMNGNLNNWWSKESYKNFKNKAQCFIEQYESYKVPNTEFKINGKLTLGENIADNSGIKQSFRAYKKYIEQIGHSEPRLPGMSNFTEDQIFFLSFAQVWCSHQTKEAQIKQVLTNEHSPAMYRVNGPLSNLPEFSKAFNCPPGSFLNPQKRCSVW
ncbi:Peptidase M13 family protein [Acanthocheilonema viteae]